MKRTNPTGHPARFSDEIVAQLAEILVGMWPDWFGRPEIFDPFAGTGEMLAALDLACAHPDLGGSTVGFGHSGVELEPEFIVNPRIVVGNATDPAAYPPARPKPPACWVVVTSPVYANGMGDNHKPRDTSKRYTYRFAKIMLTGDPDATLHPDNMGAYGYRGTMRGGRSRRRRRYWEIADAAVANWRTAEAVIVNVSDFKHSRGKVEPLVDDWQALLARHGWTSQILVPVGTKRSKNGANREERVDREVIIVARRD